MNTCAFIDSAKQESIDTILEMAQHKKDGACRRLVVTGCLAERYRDELRQQIPEIDAVLGTGEVPDIVGAIGGAAEPRVMPLTFFTGAGAPPPARTDADAVAAASHGRGSAWPQAPTSRPTYLYDAETPRLLATPKHYAYVKIAEGCDYKCAFCIIPTLRGAYRSRPGESIVAEARALAARGVKELLLISQDTTFYGIDRGERGALARLLRRLNEVDGLEWIRLLYLYPTTIDDDTLAAMAECDKVCKYIDLPLQHASNPVLKRMKRPGTRQAYDRLLERIRARVPGVALRTTFIVGFPGETDADVDELCAFLADHAFDHVGVFTYSHEEGTSRVRHGRRRPRADQARAAQPRDAPAEAARPPPSAGAARPARARDRGRPGERTRARAEGPPQHAGARHRRVRLSDRVRPSRYRAGEFADVELVGARDYDLMARPVD